MKNILGWTVYLLVITTAFWGRSEERGWQREFVRENDFKLTTVVVGEWRDYGNIDISLGAEADSFKTNSLANFLKNYFLAQGSTNEALKRVVVKYKKENLYNIAFSLADSYALRKELVFGDTSYADIHVIKEKFDGGDGKIVKFDMCGWSVFQRDRGKFGYLSDTTRKRFHSLGFLESFMPPKDANGIWVLPTESFASGKFFWLTNYSEPFQGKVDRILTGISGHDVSKTFTDLVAQGNTNNATVEGAWVQWLQALRATNVSVLSKLLDPAERVTPLNERSESSLDIVIKALDAEQKMAVTDVNSVANWFANYNLHVILDANRYAAVIYSTNAILNPKYPATGNKLWFHQIEGRWYVTDWPNLKGGIIEDTYLSTGANMISRKPALVPNY